MQDSFLHVHAVFGLFEHYGCRAVEHLVRHLRAAVRRQAVHKASSRRGLLHEFAIDLVGPEDIATHLFFGLKAHAGPGISVDGLRAGNGFRRVGKQPDVRMSFLGHALSVREYVWGGSVICRRGDAEMHAQARAEE